MNIKILSMLETDLFYEQFARYSYFILFIGLFIFLAVKTNIWLAVILWLILILPVAFLWGLIYIAISVLLKNFAGFQKKN